MRRLRALTLGACSLSGVLLAAPAAAQESLPGLPPSAAALAEHAADRAAELERAEQDEAAARTAAAATLEAYQAARRRSDAALLAVEAATDRLRAAEVRTERARSRLSAYVGSLYREGGDNAQLSFYAGVLQVREPQEFFSGLGLAKRVGGTQSNAFDELDLAEAAQEQVVARVAAASAELTAAEVEAAAAQAAADEVVGAAAQQVAADRAALGDAEQAAAEALAREQRLAQALALALERSNAPDEAVAGALVPRPEATCAGGETAGFANGRLPTASLCRLWGTNGQMLRADAAAAFDAMSRAYAEDVGAPLCVNDSYRNHDEQVAVALAKPTLAAVPGTSNHGWGVALDLCDGVQSFGTPEHAWMVENAMAFGWFHPAWAQQDGSKPEAWHWEFAG